MQQDVTERIQRIRPVLGEIGASEITVDDDVYLAELRIDALLDALQDELGKRSVDLAEAIREFGALAPGETAEAAERAGEVAADAAEELETMIRTWSYDEIPSFDELASLVADFVDAMHALFDAMEGRFTDDAQTGFEEQRRE